MSGGIRGPVVIGAGSGYTPPTAHTETNWGDVVTLNPLANGLLPFGPILVENGGTIIEVSTPTKPTVIEAGIYAITIELQYAGGTAVGYMQYNFEMDVDNNDWISSETIIPGPTLAWTSMAFTTYLPAGGVFQVRAVNVADASGDFNLGYGEIQRIT